MSSSALPPAPALSPAPAPAPAAAAVGTRQSQPLTYLAALLGACTSAVVTNPFDIIKVRQQLSASREIPRLASVVAGMYRGEGVRSFGNGVTASVVREASYGTIRMGGYDVVKTWYAPLLADFPLLQKLAAGITSGAVGALIASPADLVKVKMQAVRPEGRPPYPNTLAAFIGVYRSGGGGTAGIKALWRGVGPTVLRASILTSSQVGCYDEVKTRLKRSGAREGLGLHFSSSMVAGFIASATSQPVDVIKVRLMNDTSASGVRRYASAGQCVAELLKNEGPRAFYKGFAMCWLRLGCHSVVSLMLFERFRAIFGLAPI